ncbi:hypothetical protein B0O80DRAFT_495750 [Mortierella sp. GBAus27b]|nr:hypothetical protein B0O80DRAFT_495750 [Mortierella sp. GBAus27b]
MDSFKEFAIKDTHRHPNFGTMYSCFICYVGYQRSNGIPDASSRPDVEQCRKNHGARKINYFIVNNQAPTTDTRNDPSTAASSTSSSSTRTPSRLAGKRSVEQAPGAPNKKQRRSTQKGVIAGTSRSEDHDRDHNHHHVHDHDNNDADDNNTADFLPRSLFDKGENVNHLLIISKVDVEEQVQNCAREACNVREACFRAQYTSVVNQMAQQAAENFSKKSNGQEAPIDGQDVPTGEKSHRYLDLWDNQLLPLDPSDGDLFGGLSDSRSESSSGSSQDLTGEIPVPIAIDHLVGPGTLFSQISSNSEDHLVSHGCNISYALMKHRRSTITKPQIIKDDLFEFCIHY